MSNEQSQSNCGPSHGYAAFAVRDELLDLAEQQARIQEKRREVIDRAIAECGHELEHIRELPMQARTWVGSSAPWLICARCGLTEQGWGCGYKTLAHAAYKDVPKISKDIWYEMRTRSVFQDGHIV